MGSSSQTQETHQTVAPWGPQAEALGKVKKYADIAFNQSNAVGPYQGNFVSQVSQPGRSAMQSALDNTWNSQASANMLQNAGGDMLGGGIQNTYNALGGLQNFGATNQTAGTISDAQKYMSPDIINGQVQAAMRSANQNMTENVLPTIANNAAMSGNGISTRNGIAQGIALRGLNQQAMDTSANLTANAYNTGINAAQAGRQQQLSALSGAGGLSSNLASQGQAGLTSGINGAATAANTIGAVNQAQIGYDQNQLTNALDKVNYQKSEPFQSIDLYNSLVDSRNWGSQTDGTSTTTSNPSMMSTIGSGLGAIGGIMGKCDREAKTDIKEVGKTHDGLPIYVFRYRNDNERKLYLGLMADDVEARDPSMIIEINGMKHIRANDFYATL